MKEEFAADTFGTVTVTDVHGTWTLEGKLTYINNTSGIPPRGPGPRFPPPLRTLLAGLEDLLATGSRSIRVDLEPGNMEQQSE